MHFTRTRRAIAGSLAAFAFAGCAATTVPPQHVSIPIHTFIRTLPNGMHLVLDEDHRSPLVSVNVSYRVGSKDDPAERAGLAHLFEHLMFQGSKHVARGDHFSLLTDAGARTVNAKTTFDRTSYFETLPSNQLELALWLESDRMGFLLDSLDEATFETERNVVKNEYRQRYENVPAGLVGSIAQAELYPAPHPYNRLPIGSPDDLDRASLDDARAFFRAHYMPHEATLTIVGDLAPEAASNLVEKYFAPLGATSAADGTRGTPEPLASSLAGQRTIDVEANIDQPMLIVEWPEPPQLTVGAAEVDCILDFLQGLLHRWLVDERQVAERVRTSFGPGALGSFARIEVTMKPSASFDDVLGTIDGALSDNPFARIGAEASNHVTNQEAASLLFTFEDFGTRAERYAFYEQATGGAQFLGAHMKQYSGLASRNLQVGKESRFPKNRRVVTRVRVVKDAPIGGRRAEKT